MSKLECMLDLETLSTRSHAVILVLAAVKFDRNASSVPVTHMDSFYRRITIESCKEVGMHTDPKTVEWWQTLSEDIRKEAFEGARMTLLQALKEFTDWFGNCEKIWSQGACFDIPILDEAYKRCGLTAPWKFWNVRDTRTLYDLAGINPWNLPKDNLHNALYDCWRQIIGVQMAMKKLEVRK